MVSWCSVGEILSIIPLVEKFEKNKNINQILITSNTVSSSKIINKYKLKKQFINFFQLIVILYQKNL